MCETPFLVPARVPMASPPADPDPTPSRNANSATTNPPRPAADTFPAEAAFLLGVGMVAGTVSAAIAIAPAWLGRGGALPGAGLMLLLAAVVVAGILSSAIATRAALRGRILEALRAE